ncbi:MAG: phosphoribosyltransferase [Firmicutes bacterium]|nr:phosphoribosyltransferase [Bacillota bacterium]
MQYKNFSHAGMELAAAMKNEKFKNPVILAVVWGGVEIGAEVSNALNIPLDVVKPLKITAPGTGALIGAVAGLNEVFIDQVAVEKHNITDEYLKNQIEEKKGEIARIENICRKILPAKNLSGKTIIITDDGIATGATMTAAIKALRSANPESVIVATPVAKPESLEIIKKAADEVICLQSPEDFESVESFYEYFAETPMERITELMQKQIRP